MAMIINETPTNIPLCQIYETASPRPALHEAIMARDELRIKELLASGFDLQTPDSSGATALRVALKSSVLPAVVLLSQWVTEEDCIFAACHSTVEVIEFLVTLPVVLQNQEEIITAMFDEAAGWCSPDAARWLLERYVLEYPHVMGECLLSPSFGTSSLTLVKECVHKIEQLQLEGGILGDLLYDALTQRKQECVSFLFDHIKDLSYFDNIGDCLAILTEYPDEAFLEQVFAKFPTLQDEKRKTELFLAVAQGNYSEVKRVLAEGGDPNCQDASGRSILEEALQQVVGEQSQAGNITGKSLNLIQLLISRGASISQTIAGCYKNIFDFAVSHLNYGLLFALHPYFQLHITLSDAALNKFFNTCEEYDLEFITRYYQELDLQTNTFTVCHALIRRGRLDLLMKYEALAPHKFQEYLHDKTKTFITDDRLSLLALALKEKKEDIAQFLRTKGATVNQDPLLLAISPEITAQFLSEGMHYDEQDVHGNTALYYIAGGDGDISCLPLLLKSGADLFLKISGNMTPFERACDIENFPFMQEAIKTEAFARLPRPALFQAILTNDVAAIDQLAASSDITIKDSFGHTAVEFAIFIQSLAGVKRLSHHASTSELTFAASWGSVEVVSFLCDLLLPKIEKEQKSVLVEEMFQQAKEAHNAELTKWIGEEYVFQSPKMFRLGLFLDMPAPKALAVLEQNLEWLKKDPEKIFIVRKLLLQAVGLKQFQIATILLDMLEDPPFVVDAEVELFLLHLVQCQGTFFQKGFQKIGLSGLLTKRNLILHLKKALDYTFPEVSQKLFGYCFVFCKEKQNAHPQELNDQELNDLVLGLIHLACLTRSVRFVQMCYLQFPHFAALKERQHVQVAIKEGFCEIVAYLLQQVQPLNQDQTNICEEELFFAITGHSKQICLLLLQSYATQKITPNFGNIYVRLLCEVSKEQQKEAVQWAVGLQKGIFTTQECEEVADFMMNSAPFGSCVRFLASLLSKALPFSQIKEISKEVTNFVQKLPQSCKIPCGHWSLHQTMDWLIDQIFNHCRAMNPSLFKKGEDMSTILPLLQTVQKSEDYGALLVALQVAPDFAVAESAVHLATGSMIKPSKEVFIGKDKDEQYKWLAFALVYRDRSFLSHCYHILKHQEQFSDLLVVALNVLTQIGVKRYNSKFKNTLASKIKQCIQTSKNEKVKIAALKAYMVMEEVSCNPLVLDFLLLELASAKDCPEYEVEVIRSLGTGYEWISDEECSRAVKQLLPGLKSDSNEVREASAMALASIPHEKGLLAALEVVQSSVWDSMLPYFGKNRQNIQGSFLLFRKRPAPVHDNRSAMVERIFLQLMKVYEKNESFCKLVKEQPLHPNRLSQIEQHFRLIPSLDTRYVGFPVMYPPQTDLIRGISTRKGRQKFRESVRDLFRKGAGSSELTDYDVCLYNNTWNKIGHIFASHNKDLYFGSEQGSCYFSADTSGVVTESALIVFPAAFYHKEYFAGQARLEKENTLNNVLYRGIPHRWIKAVYLPVRFQHDINLLASNTPLEEVAKKLESDLFTGDSPKELDGFRRFLLAREVDLTQGPIQEPAKEVSFVEKIRYFPAVDAKKVGEFLQKEGVCFATEQQIIEETAKSQEKISLFLRSYCKNPWHFRTQDGYLLKASDQEFKENREWFFKMMPSSLGPLDGAKKILFGDSGGVGLQTDSVEKMRAPLRVAAILLAVGKQAKEVLLENPAFYGITRAGVVVVESLMRQYTFVQRYTDPKSDLTIEAVKKELLDAFTLLRIKDVSFECYCECLLRLFIAESSRSKAWQEKAALIIGNKALEFETFQWLSDLKA
jgi:ankyrin repeat protein